MTIIPRGPPLLLLFSITNMADGNEVVVSKKAKAAFCGKFRILISVFVVKGFRTNAALYIQVMYRRKERANLNQASLRLCWCWISSHMMEVKALISRNEQRSLPANFRARRDCTVRLQSTFPRGISPTVGAIFEVTSYIVYEPTFCTKADSFLAWMRSLLKRVWNYQEGVAQNIHCVEFCLV